MRSQFDKYFLADLDGRSAGIATRVFWDLSNVKALQEDIDRKATRYSTAYKDKAVSKNEYRAQLGLKPVPGGDFIPNDQEAYEQAQEQFEPNNEPDDDETTEPVKSLKARREPPSEEAEQAAAVGEVQDEARKEIAAALLLLKAGLIQQGLEKLRQLGDDFAQLRLVLTPEEMAQLTAPIEQAYRAGAATVTPSITPPDTDLIFSLTKILASALTLHVAARLTSSFALWLTRGWTLDDAIAATGTELNAESPVSYEAMAASTGYQAVAAGRGKQAQVRGYKRVYYSAILDAKVCPPCKKKDGLWSDKAEDLPPVPSPECDGRWRCRCAHIFIWE